MNIYRSKEIITTSLILLSIGIVFIGAVNAVFREKTVNFSQIMFLIAYLVSFLAFLAFGLL